MDDNGPQSMPALVDALLEAIDTVEAELAMSGPVRQGILKWMVEYTYQILERAPMPDIEARINHTNEQSLQDGVFGDGVLRDNYAAWIQIAKDVCRRVGSHGLQ